MKPYFIIALLLILGKGLWAQGNWRKKELPYLSPSVYTTSDKNNNPYYWKIRKPYFDYWQQDVHYEIVCNLQPEYNKIEGVSTLTYRNNSKDKLDELYFHLYQNAFTPNSYMDKMYKQKNEKYDYGYHGNSGKGTDILYVEQEGRKVKYEIDNTIMKVMLYKPLYPGEQVVIKMEFTTYFSEGNTPNRRMKIFKEKVKNPQGFIYDVTHFDVAHWYPRVAVYDQKFRWNLDQHLGHEFYGDFGSFDVQITIPQYYIMEATGVLKNKSEALPEDLEKKIALSNFAEKPFNSPADEIIPKDDSKTKIWHYHAINVHDFAFTADPTYRREELKLGDISCVAMARERKAAKWQDAAEYCSKFINLYNNDIGRYLYPKMVVADADDGMEYPMLTLDGGTSPEYYSLFAHEIGHNWFYGMVGNNETYRAFMDEGFTQFLTVWSMEKVVGKHDPAIPKWLPKTPIRYAEAYGGYLDAAIHDDDGILSTHSDDFGGPGSSPDYSQVYTKTATMLYNLKYVMGEEAFLAMMKSYFNKWKLKHPYPEDFIASVTEFTKKDFNWFFDPWLNTDKKIDYKIKNVRAEYGNKTTITFERVGEMAMPIDFTVVTNEGKFKYHIPVSEYTKADSSVIILDKWVTHGGSNPQYTVKIPHKVRNVWIDPYHLLADVNLLNNSRRPPIKLQTKILPLPQIFSNWESYNLNIRPSIWGNAYSGLQTGIHLSGGYMREKHVFSLAGWYNTGWGKTPSPTLPLRIYNNKYQKFTYKFDYQTLVKNFGKGSKISAFSAVLDGAHRHGFEISYKIPKGSFHSPIYNKIYVKYIWLYRKDSAFLDYLILPQNWGLRQANSTLNVGFERNYKLLSGTGNIDILLRTPTIGSQSNYSYAALTSIHRLSAGKFTLNGRLFGRYGTGKTPLESALYLAGGSPEEMYENAFYRGRGFFPYNWSVTSNQTTGHAHYGGGLNLRGYTGTTGALTDGRAAWFGSSGAAINIELDFQRLIPLIKENYITNSLLDFRIYTFYDGGILGDNEVGTGKILDPIRWGQFFQDAGIGSAFHLGNEKYGIKNIDLRADFPFWVSHPSGGQKSVAMRWLLSVSKTF